jgi:hypothetical protein
VLILACVLGGVAVGGALVGYLSLRYIAKSTGRWH